jgi:uncharacterized membrane protein YeaQ/YmgE (transglycosylase-associated protein family)
MFAVEIGAGLAAGSASLQADALDFLGDAANYAISLLVVGMAIWNQNERSRLSHERNWSVMMGILWTLIIGFLAGVIAKFLHPGPNEPSWFIVTTLLGIAGAFVATYLGQAVGWYQPGEGAGLIGAV